jgi:hypothetical protein
MRLARLQRERSGRLSGELVKEDRDRVAVAAEAGLKTSGAM